MTEQILEILQESKFLSTSNKNIFTNLGFLLILTFLALYAHYHWKRRKLYICASKVNGPFALPFVGNGLDFIGSNFDILSKTMLYSKMYKSPARVWLGPKLCFAIWKPHQLEIVLNQALEKDDFYKLTEVVVGTGLFTASVPKWKRHRKIITPTFNQKALESFVEVFSEKAQVLVEQLQKEVNKGTFDMFHYISRCTLDMICETAMGVKINALTTDCEYMHWLSRCLEITFMRMASIWYKYDFIFKWSPMAKGFYEDVNKLLSFSGNIVTERRIAYQQRMESNKHKPEPLMEEEPRKRKTFLDQLIELSEEGANFTDEELREEVDTFMIGGSETTASALSFICIMLGMFPDVQEKVHKEIIDVLGTERDVESKDLVNFVYLERVIKETLRILPVGPILVRAVTEDIKVDSYTIPAGSSVIVNVIGLHRDPETWKDPLKFDPDRFLPEELAKRHAYCYLPYAGGIRYCVGTKFAMLAMKTILATIVRKYHISTTYKTVEDIRLQSDIMLKAVDGHKVSIKLRQ